MNYIFLSLTPPAPESAPVTGPALRLAAVRSVARKAGKLSVVSEALAQGFPIAFVEGREEVRGEGRCAAAAGLADRPAGFEEKVAHAGRPRLRVEGDQRLQFAQVMGVAQRMRCAFHSAGVRLEAVMHGDAPFELLRQIAAFGRDAIKGEPVGGDRMQPLRPAADAKAGLVEAAHRRRAGLRADPGGHGQKGLSAPPRPFGQARRAEALRAEQIGKRLRRAVLGDQLLRMQINARRLDALAILGWAGNPFGKGRPRPAAAEAQA